jgi:hypothetical protein
MYVMYVHTIMNSHVRVSVEKMYQNEKLILKVLFELFTRVQMYQNVSKCIKCIKMYLNDK